MEQRNVRICSLRPADEHVAESIHPAMRALDNPPPRSVSRFLLDLFRLFATRTNVRRKAELLQQRRHLSVVVPLVETHALRLLLARSRAFDGNALERLTRHLEVVAIGAVDGEAHRN